MEGGMVRASFLQLVNPPFHLPVFCENKDRRKFLEVEVYCIDQPCNNLHSKRIILPFGLYILLTTCFVQPQDLTFHFFVLLLFEFKV